MLITHETHGQAISNFSVIVYVKSQFCTVLGSSSTISEAHSRWAQLEAASGMALRELEIHLGYELLASICPIRLKDSQGERLVGAVSVIKARAPVTGGNFGVWGGMFSTFDCAVKSWRQKEDAWNAIISGFMTGGCLAARSEYLSCCTSECFNDSPCERWSERCPGICCGLWDLTGRI